MSEMLLAPPVRAREDSTSEPQNYHAQLYYFGNQIDWRIYFTVTRDLEALSKVRFAFLL